MSLRAVLINVGRFIGSICDDKTKPHRPSPAHTGFNTIDISQMRLWGWQVLPVALAQVSLMHKPNATWLPTVPSIQQSLRGHYSWTFSPLLCKLLFHKQTDRMPLVLPTWLTHVLCSLISLPPTEVLALSVIFKWLGQNIWPKRMKGGRFDLGSKLEDSDHNSMDLITARVWGTWSQCIYSCK